MTIPVPSQVRVVRLCRERAPIRSRNLVGPTTRYRWPAMHPLTPVWSWVNATGWCEDICDVIGAFTSSNVAFTAGDGAMSIIAVAKSEDSKQVGIRFIGGISGVDYALDVTLSGSLGANSETFGITLPCHGLLPLGRKAPWLANYSTARNSGMTLLV